VREVGCWTREIQNGAEYERKGGGEGGQSSIVETELKRRRERGKGKQKQRVKVDEKGVKV
jgi:hypothetical protein